MMIKDGRSSSPPTSPAPQTLASGPHSCEASFGNGFTRHLDLLSAVDGGGGGRGGAWFRCFTLESSICEGRAAEDVAGEDQDGGGRGKVGRRDGEERRGGGDAGVGGRRVPDRRGRGWPQVLVVVGKNYVDQGKRHPVRNLIGSIRVVKPGESRRDQVMLLIDLFILVSVLVVSVRIQFIGIWNLLMVMGIRHCAFYTVIWQSRM
ncbi:hypothetical protein EUGRSUZ_F00781 [Eucalyptus grandis]|uniref:Uncharacterized protein n=2 Tax=Eucalyptus grandis TaxID=71139 RepID=A0ACC3KCR7_EUCGR|nr:hypothetical protein EUGRSUZ_F00781 [Eucalyptus grandis]